MLRVWARATCDRIAARQGIFMDEKRVEDLYFTLYRPCGPNAERQVIFTDEKRVENLYRFGGYGNVRPAGQNAPRQVIFSAPCSESAVACPYHHTDRGEQKCLSLWTSCLITRIYSRNRAFFERVFPSCVFYPFCGPRRMC